MSDIVKEERLAGALNFEWCLNISCSYLATDALGK